MLTYTFTAFGYDWEVAFRSPPVFTTRRFYFWPSLALYPRLVPYGATLLCLDCFLWGVRLSWAPGQEED